MKVLDLQNISIPQKKVERKRKTLQKALEKKMILPESEKYQLLDVLLDNSLRYVTAIESATTAGGIAPIETYVYPILVRAIPQLIAPEIVSVQPINSTQAAVRLMYLEYGLDKGDIRERDNAPASYTSNVVFNPYYTGPYVDGEPFAAVINSNGSANVILEYLPVSEVKMVISIDNTGYTSVIFQLGTDTTISNVNGSSVSVTFDGRNTVTFNNAGGNSVTVSARFYYEIYDETAPYSPDITLRVEKKLLNVEFRKLRMAYSLEAQAELAAHEVDLSSKIAQLMADQVALEIDRTVLAGLRNAAINAGYVKNTNITTFNGAALSEFLKRQPIGEWFKNLLYELEVSSAEIYKRTRRVQANFIVTSPKIAALLESTNLIYRPTSDAHSLNTIAQGIVPVGILTNKWRVYVDPFFPPDQILMGYKGDSVFDSGAVYAPYTPAIPVKEAIMNASVPNFMIHVGIFKGYAWLVYEPGFYQVIRIMDIDSLA